MIMEPTDDTSEYDVIESLSENLEPDARPVCLDCFTPCDKLQYYCHNCDSFNPVNPLAAYIPFVRLRMHYGFYCTMWRMLWYDTKISLILRFVFLLFICFPVPIMFVFGIGFLLFSKNAKPYISVKLKNTLLITAILVTALDLFLLYAKFFYFSNK